jgi:hypothetical protein
MSKIGFSSGFVAILPPELKAMHSSVLSSRDGMSEVVPQSELGEELSLHSPSNSQRNSGLGLGLIVSLELLLWADAVKG